MGCKGSKEGKWAAYASFSVQNDSLASFMQWNNVPASHLTFQHANRRLLDSFHVAPSILGVDKCRKDQVFIRHVFVFCTVVTLQIYKDSGHQTF